MKKILVLSIFILQCFLLEAQSPSIGLKAGINFTNLWIKNSNSTDYRTGFNAGALAHFHLSNKWAFQPEVMYSGQGGKQTVNNYTSKLNLNYLNVPLLFQYMFLDGFRLQAGPQVGFLLGAKNKVNGVETDVKNKYKSIDFSFPVGIGYLCKSGFGIDGRWVPGFIDIQESGNSIANNVFQLGLFYQLKKHK